MAMINAKTCDCSQLGVRCYHARDASDERRRRAYWARKRKQEQLEPPAKGEPRAICDVCNKVRKAKAVKQVYVWPRTRWVCVACK